jgi:gliding motility-associated-like protein
LISTVYTIQVQSLNGCTGQDHVKVIVDRRRQIYVPNVFTPNDDGANDLFTIYASPGSVRKILSLQVFDRWGEALIALKDFLPNNPTIGWDGSYKGEPMNPGVFVWVAEIEFIDGKREVFQGDVTVVR